MTTRHLILTGFQIALAISVAVWSIGVIWFFMQIPGSVSDDRKVDAIVVLTGGNGRVKYGLDLLEAGKAKALFISGVGKDVKFPELVAMYNINDMKLSFAETESLITLGYAANDTVGNAKETAQWVRQNGHGSIRLVTSSYHFPRSLMEFRLAMPGVEILPDPVPIAYEKGQWPTWLSNLRFLALEYHKFLVRAAYHHINGHFKVAQAKGGKP